MNWISVKERLPTPGKNVLYIDIRRVMFVGHYISDIYNDGFEYSCWKENSLSCGCFCGETEVTHWMELPEPPIDGE